MTHFFNMIGLQNIATVANPAVVAQANCEITDRLLFTPFLPTYVSGVPTTIIGPPTTGLHYKGEVWTDANGARFECTSSPSGTPGTWRQVSPAYMSADPVLGTYPTGYLIARTGQYNMVRVCMVGGTPGSWAWAGRGLNSISDLAGGASLSDVIATVNTILSRLRATGDTL